MGYNYHWDPYLFILLSVLFSAQAAYAAPVIMIIKEGNTLLMVADWYLEIIASNL